MTAHEEKPGKSSRSGRRAWDRIQKYLDGFKDHPTSLISIFSSFSSGEPGWYFEACSAKAERDGSPYYKLEGWINLDGVIRSEWTSARGSWS